MRWDELFADLEAQAEALDVAERAAEVEERTRAEQSAIGLRERLLAAPDAPLRLQLPGGLQVSGSLARVGADWLLLDEGQGREALVPLAALRTLIGLSRFAAVPGTEGRVLQKLVLRTALRGVARDRSAVRIHLLDGEVVEATVDRVGKDFLDAARHPAGEPRRRGEVRDSVTVPIAAIAAVRRSR